MNIYTHYCSVMKRKQVQYCLERWNGNLNLCTKRYTKLRSVLSTEQIDLCYFGDYIHRKKGKSIVPLEWAMGGGILKLCPLKVSTNTENVQEDIIRSKPIFSIRSVMMVTLPSDFKLLLLPAVDNSGHLPHTSSIIILSSIPTTMMMTMVNTSIM